MKSTKHSKIKIPKGWRRMKAGDKRPAEYRWWNSNRNRWEDGDNAWLKGRRITKEDMVESGPYIRRIKPKKP